METSRTQNSHQNWLIESRVRPFPSAVSQILVSPVSLRLIPLLFLSSPPSDLQAGGGPAPGDDAAGSQPRHGPGPHPSVRAIPPPTVVAFGLRIRCGARFSIRSRPCRMSTSSTHSASVPSPTRGVQHHLRDALAPPRLRPLRPRPHRREPPAAVTNMAPFMPFRVILVIE